MVRARRSGADANGKPALVVPGVFAEPAWRWIQIESSGQGIRIRVDGDVRHEQRGAPLGGWNPAYSIAVGDEVAGGRGFPGA